MTALNMRTTHRVRNMLLATCAAVALGVTAAQADVVSTGSSGFWTAHQGQDVCMITTTLPGINATVVIITSSGDQRLHVAAFKQSWNIPANTRTSMSFQIDKNTAWQKPNAAIGDTHVVGMAVAPSAAPTFVHEITVGSTLHIYFSGNEQPWKVSLSGTTGVWPQFMSCAQMVAPAMIASLNPTQPFATQEPSQPASPTPPAPPTQPFNGV